MLEAINQYLEHWEPLWLFLVLYKELIVGIFMLYYVRKEWFSSDSLDKKLDQVLDKYVKRIELTNQKLLAFIKTQQQIQNKPPQEKSDGRQV